MPPEMRRRGQRLPLAYQGKMAKPSRSASELEEQERVLGSYTADSSGPAQRPLRSVLYNACRPDVSTTRFLTSA